MIRSLATAFCLLSCSLVSRGETEDPIAEAFYYRLFTYPVPDHLKLEASGLAVLPDGRLAVSIRKGEVWILENPLTESAKPKDYAWKRFASGLHEPIGLTWHDGALYTAQRSEVTRLEDRDGDGIADAYLTAAKGWGVTGNYHEYVYGPVFDPAGNLWLNLNLNLGKGQDVAGPFKTDTSWRGWTMRKPPGGKLRPLCAGLRSPIGIGLNHLGDLFATDQQGNWWGACALLHLREGVFFGHVDSLRDANRPESLVKHPGSIPKKGLTAAEAPAKIPGYAPPAVWFPYTKIGMSATSIRCDSTGGKFGPFADQLFIGEFTESFMSRVFLETVKGEYQGACFHFRKGLQCAVLSHEFLPDGSMVIGESNRGWNSLGTRSYGMERLIWTGKTPFEIEKMEALPRGFRLTFTKPVDRDAAASLYSYRMSSYTWNHHSTYGSEEIETEEVKITGAKVSDDRLSVELTCENLREHYCHELNAEGVWSADRMPLLHPQAFYTLNAIPGSRAR